MTTTEHYSCPPPCLSLMEDVSFIAEILYVPVVDSVETSEVIFYNPYTVHVPDRQQFLTGGGPSSRKIWAIA